MQFFITGASGYIGSVITKKAIAEGHTVHGLCRSDAGEAKLKALGAVPIRGELSSLETLQSESAKADAVIHCAFIHDCKCYISETHSCITMNCTSWYNFPLKSSEETPLLTFNCRHS